jgi:cell division protein FtsQ
MRRVRDRGAPGDAGLLVSPGEIIARAAATVPEDEGAEAKVKVWAPERDRDRGSDDNTIFIGPAAAPMRRARRRPRDTLRYAWFYTSRGAVAVALLAGVVGLPIWLFKSGTIDDASREAKQTYADLRHRADTAVSVALDKLTVEGRNRSSRESLRAALQIKKGDNLLAADPWAIKKRLEALPWIRSATVERRYPNTMVVTLVERTPIARFRDKSGTVLVDDTGALIKVQPEPEHENLILLIGEGAPEAAADLVKLLEDEPALARRILSATRYGQRRWDIAFDGGATLRLPDGHAKAALAKFGEFDRQHSLLARGPVTYDMRLPDRMVIRNPRGPTPATAPAVAPAPTPKPAVSKPPKKTG